MKRISPLLWENEGVYVTPQATPQMNAFEACDRLGNDEAIEIVGAELWHHPVSGAILTTYAYLIARRLDAAPDAAGFLVQTMDPDTFVNLDRATLFLTSGISYAAGELFVNLAMGGEGLVLTQGLTLVGTSGQNEHNIYSRIYFYVVKLTSEELLSYVARRR